VIKAGQVSKGVFLLVKGQPHQVTEREFVNPGKGQAFVRLKLKSLITGLTIKETYKTPETLEDIEVESKAAQFLYADGESYHFMDSETFEQIAVPLEGLEEKQNYLKEGDSFELVVYDGRPIDISIPYKMVFEVTQAEPGARGDTVSGASKPVTIETGFKVKVPIFIKEGDRIMINTETGEYVERVN
jgi:elongation factor P